MGYDACVLVLYEYEYEVRKRQEHKNTVGIRVPVQYCTIHHTVQ